MKKRIVVALTMALSLAPLAGNAAGDESKPFHGTTCTIGDETLSYDAPNLQFVLSASVDCKTVYPALGSDVRLVSAVGLPFTPVAVPMHALDGCFDCASVTPVARMYGSLEGVFRVTSNGSVSSATGYTIQDTHSNCFLVHDFTVVPLLGSC